MGRKTAAVYISNLYMDMVRETVEGVQESARRHDVKLLFFTSFSDNFSSRQYARYKNYDTGDFVVFLLADPGEYDGLISFDTYMPILYLDPVDRLKAQANCPVITLGTVKDGTYSVVNDQDRSMREVIEHVILAHGCKDIMHVAGNREMSFTRERIDIFRETLERYGLPCGDDRIVYGDLSPECGDAVVAEMLERRAAAGMPALPEGIVCANDYMAIGVCKALRLRGVRVPRDVIVTGYDDILRARFNEPSITTSAQPFRQVGWMGMEVLASLWAGEAPKPVIAVPGVLACRQSCGCEPFYVYKKDTIREKYIDTVSRMENLIQSNTNLILGAATDETVEDVFNEIEESCLRETGFRDAVLCLIRDWDKKKVIRSRADLRDATFDIVCGMYSGCPVRRRALPKGALVPEEMMDSPEPCFLYPIHHMQYFMGYFVVSPDLKDLGQLHIKSWLMSISTILENWCIRRQLTQSVEELEQLYRTDMLTGLFNRRGYYMSFEEYYRACREAQTNLAVFLIDMNHMKAVNDNYGHAEGDYCLCAIADAMRRCATMGEICVRTGGDEFVVLAKHYDRARAEAYVRALREALDEVRRRDGKPYELSVSVGYSMMVPPADDAISAQNAAELFLRRADRAMYAEKKKLREGLCGPEGRDAPIQ